MEYSLLPYVVIAIVIGAAIYWHYVRMMRRRRELTAWAKSKGLSFHHQKDRGIHNSYPRFHYFSRGHSKYARNHMRGSWKGFDFYGFDYHYATGGGKSTRHYHLSGVILRTDLDFPNLYIRPETFFDKIKDNIGFDDIDFESIAFSNRYHVKCSDEKFAFDVLHQRTMEYLLSLRDYSMQFDGYDAIIYTERQFEPDQFGEVADVLCGILDRLPGYIERHSRLRL